MAHVAPFPLVPCALCMCWGQGGFFVPLQGPGLCLAQTKVRRVTIQLQLTPGGSDSVYKSQIAPCLNWEGNPFGNCAYLSMCFIHPDSERMIKTDV